MLPELYMDLQIQDKSKYWPIIQYKITIQFFDYLSYWSQFLRSNIILDFSNLIDIGQNMSSFIKQLETMDGKWMVMVSMSMNLSMNFSVSSFFDVITHAYPVLSSVSSRLLGPSWIISFWDALTRHIICKENWEITLQIKIFRCVAQFEVNLVPSVQIEISTFRNFE